MEMGNPVKTILTALLSGLIDPFPLGLIMPQIYLLLILLLIACGRARNSAPLPVVDQMPGTTMPEIESNYLKIFPSLTLWDGSSGKETMVLDAGCTLDAQRMGLKGSYKALVSSKERRACTSADCQTKGREEHLDWVLEPNMEYRLSDGKTVFGYTNELSLFDFPLKNSLSSHPKKIWTGFAEYWTSPYYSFESCAKLTNKRETGFVGEASSLGSNLLKVSNLSSCEEKYSVICVESPTLPNDPLVYE